ncbi:CO or xanthine dehydrogenase, Mo-binding subunit [Noviherbaspirillum humi]|uniref:CO or xanthine dehydrogenase, Mo-binding subunit n=1 Tax=Noviherbaspirillum humi TaxID=1688639 RepID=A0A239KK95_9BURK|nr:molybdopterin cofactor-binding domain-containing protein [Noviherbaspirillum humi]SNT18118.1 CO or xanthine dehydrogenase, Mo-binding subunit [Noviherbaspirillum humi]
MAYVIATQGADAGKAALPGSLQVNRRLDQWLRFRPGGYVDVTSGKVELGQGILTALAQIVAEELDLRLDQVRMLPASTDRSPNEAVTSGSLSVQESGMALRQACAEARRIMLEAAAARLGADPPSLQIREGVVDDGSGRSLSYWELADDALLAREADGRASPKAGADYRMVGAPASRLDLPDKVFGNPRFIHDIELPGLLHAAMVRAPSVSARLASLGDLPEKFAGASVVRDGSLLAVLAPTRRLAEQAASALAERAEWRVPEDTPPMPAENDLEAWLKSQPADTKVVDSRRPADGRTHAAHRSFHAAYVKPFIAHASIGPSCALALFEEGVLTVWSHSQGIYNLRKDLALALRMDEQDIVVRHAEGAGCYGHNGADDVAFDAAWLALARPGTPIRVVWSRADELSAAPFGPAMAVELRADVDAHGRIVAWRQEVWSNGHSTRPGRAATPALLGSWQLAQPFAPPAPINAPLAAGGGSERNAVPSYDFPSWDVINHRVLTTPIRTSALRALGAVANVFAAESFIDEMARELDVDAIAFRLRHVSDERARAVIKAAAEAAGLGIDSPRAEGEGWGFAWARYKNTSAYCAVAAQVVVAEAVRVRRLFIAADIGTVINPDGAVNQLEGGAIQAASMALKEAVRFEGGRIASDSWDNYPILRFSEVPQVTTLLMPSQQPPLGAGEASLGPTVAAIANAVRDAIGLRPTSLPLTAERLAAMALAAD